MEETGGGGCGAGYIHTHRGESAQPRGLSILHPEVSLISRIKPTRVPVKKKGGKIGGGSGLGHFPS